MISMMSLTFFTYPVGARRRSEHLPVLQLQEQDEFQDFTTWAGGRVRWTVDTSPLEAEFVFSHSCSGKHAALANTDNIYRSVLLYRLAF